MKVLLILNTGGLISSSSCVNWPSVLLSSHPSFNLWPIHTTAPSLCHKESKEWVDFCSTHFTTHHHNMRSNVESSIHRSWVIWTSSWELILCCPMFWSTEAGWPLSPQITQVPHAMTVPHHAVIEEMHRASCTVNTAPVHKTWEALGHCKNGTCFFQLEEVLVETKYDP
jgi:hypothetical protein